jgi:hypothetical protein
MTEEPVEEVEPEILKPRKFGGRQPGSGRPKGSPNKITREIKEIALDYGISEQLAELFRGNEGNTLGAEIARRAALPPPNGQQPH